MNALIRFLLVLVLAAPTLARAQGETIVVDDSPDVADFGGGLASRRAPAIQVAVVSLIVFVLWPLGQVFVQAIKNIGNAPVTRQSLVDALNAVSAFFQLALGIGLFGLQDGLMVSLLWRWLALLESYDEFPDFFFQPQVYRADGEHVMLPPGKYNVTFTRGPEYVAQQRELIVPEGA